jgi:osmotically-inducible protein OsmY
MCLGLPENAVREQKRSKGVPMRKFLPAAVAAAIAAWFVSSPRGRVVFGRLHGKLSGVLPKRYDDWTLKAKVESELFRDEHEIKGAINVNAQEGVVQLRGEVPSQDLIDALVERTRKIHGVREVESLLHTPATEAPMHQ